MKCTRYPIRFIGFGVVAVFFIAFTGTRKCPQRNPQVAYPSVRSNLLQPLDVAGAPSDFWGLRLSLPTWYLAGEKPSPQWVPSQAESVLQELKKHTKAYMPSNEEVYLVEKYFSNRTGYLSGGVYVELGALNGLNYSNSYGLEKVLGWKGLLIEPSIDNYFEVLKNRPKAISVNTAVCSKLSTVHYLSFPGRRDVGGILEFMTQTHFDIIKKWPEFPEELRGFDKLDTQMLSQTPKVACMGLQTVLDLLQLHHISFLSLDVEGAEFEVLKTLNLSKIVIDVVCIEASGHEPAKEDRIRQYMLSNGFKFDGHVHQNDWFVRQPT
jgi:hypothetical protein